MELQQALQLAAEKRNFILMSDSYKYGHADQYPPQTTTVYSYMEARGAELGLDRYTVFAGLQPVLMDLFSGVRITMEDIDVAETIINAHVPNGKFNRKGWEFIVNECGGKLPLRIKALPEGTICSTGIPLITVENTRPEAYWLTNFVETILLNVYSSINVATISHQMMAIIRHYMKVSGGNMDGCVYKLHDFGARSVSNALTAGQLGCAHLSNSMGTDTVQSIIFAAKYYGVDYMPAFSIPASEHSTMTSWGAAREPRALANMIDSYDGVISCVSDSYNIYQAVAHYYGNILKDKILERDGCLVVRPDSGNPVSVLCGDKSMHHDDKVLEKLMHKGLLQILWEKFGGTVNEAGYRVLNNKVRLIQGDGINIMTLKDICRAIVEKGYSIENIAFGSGGGLLAKHDRDTFKWAFKCSYTSNIFGEMDVFKSPIGQDDKRSKKGMFKVVKEDGTLVCVNHLDEREDVLQTVFEDGDLLVKTTLGEIRQRIADHEASRNM